MQDCDCEHTWLARNNVIHFAIHLESEIKQSLYQLPKSSWPNNSDSCSLVTILVASESTLMQLFVPPQSCIICCNHKVKSYLLGLYILQMGLSVGWAWPFFIVQKARKVGIKDLVLGEDALKCARAHPIFLLFRTGLSIVSL